MTDWWLFFSVKLADLIERDIEYLAQLETYNCGKTLKFSIWDMHHAASTLRYYAGWADKIHGQTIPAGFLNLNSHEQFYFRILLIFFC